MIFVISFLVYFGLDLTPGDAVSHMISPELAATITPEKIEAMREAFGLNASFLERYWIWLKTCLQGDFGYSMAGGVSIIDIMKKNSTSNFRIIFCSSNILYYNWMFTRYYKCFKKRFCN